MFKVVGKGIFTKELLVAKLKEWGIVDTHTVIQIVERDKRCACGDNIRILLLT
ncbi:hypothetical protein [Paenibacillus elgii]|uniref:hypothetical protein n=1 Tax=Paenibacillus elgii TaxID=189691 RepID=UPI000248D646|nr:hypothetical protein [Paenibacillus elgii]